MFVLLTAAIRISAQGIKTICSGMLQPCFGFCDHQIEFGIRTMRAYYSVCDVVAVHPHLRVDVDQVPPESFTLQPLPQSLPFRDITNINP